jgi:two-component system response regulator FlrC
MRVMIIGELDGYGTSAAQIAMQSGAKVFQVSTVEEGVTILRSGKGCDLALIDVLLDVKKFMDTLNNERFVIEVVACGVTPNPKKAAEAIRAGAKEYIPLPPDPEMIAAILKAVSKEDKTVICEDPEMLKIFEFAKRIAPTEANVLLTGESGTGKEVIANYIHQHSRRSEKPFVSINCAAIPENLLESELFGHEKGAFTGAVARRIGKFEEADGGTLLLDEVTEMHPRLQAKLLRAIQERVIDRVGGTTPVKVDIRIIATSNRDMMEATRKGDFREDLYFRLNVVNLQLLPLKARPKDIEPLAKYFAKKYSEINHMTFKEFSFSAKQALLMHPWRGNVRELENLIHRGVLLSMGEQIQAEDIFGATAPIIMDRSASFNPAQHTGNLIGRTVCDVEKELILSTLDHCLGNRTHAANILGISIRTLRNKLKEYAGENFAMDMGA